MNLQPFQRRFQVSVRNRLIESGMVFQVGLLPHKMQAQHTHALNVLELVKLNAVIFFPAYRQKRNPVKLVIQAQKVLSSVLARKLGIVPVGSQILLIQPSVFLRDMAAGPGDNFLLQRVAGELLRIHPVHIDR